MPNPIRVRRSISTGAVPAAGVLTLAGELFVNTADGRMFVSKGDGSYFELTPNVRVSATNSVASITPNAALYNQYNITALATGLTINAPTNSTDGAILRISIKDNGSTQTLSWNAAFVNVGGGTLDTSTTAGKVHHYGFIYSLARTRWELVAKTIEA